jgi:CDP-paratose 2-epimerase
MNVLITGGCGFVGSNIALKIKNDYPSSSIIVVDNLKRRGSELNINRLSSADVQFVHGDIRKSEDLDVSEELDLIIDAAAEPSVLAGINGGTEYLYETNLTGTFNILNLAAKKKAKVIFLSTSRIYPIQNILDSKIEEMETRYKFAVESGVYGISSKGISEELNLLGARTIYGTTKLSSELLMKEYESTFGVDFIINRCGVIAGPHQMGKIDQGFVVLWLARHYWKKNLSYIGFGGTGKQARDIIHVDDLSDLISIQIKKFDRFKGETFNVGGGNEVSASLKEFTGICEEVTGNKINFTVEMENRPGDIPLYISDCSKLFGVTDWRPQRSITNLAEDVFVWINENEKQLKPILY